MNSYFKIVLLLTVVFFWADFLLNTFAPACADGYVTMSTPRHYFCVLGKPYSAP